MALVLHHSRATGTDKLVLLGIANHSGDGGAWPTIETLARYANATTRTVQRSLSKLVDLGEVAIYQQQGGTRDMRDSDRPNRYDVLIACPPGCDRTANHRVRDLPRSQAELWIEGVTPTSGGDAHVTRGVTPTSGEGVTPTSPKPSLEPSTNYLGREGSPNAHVPASVGQLPLCHVCLLTYDQCVIRERTSGHTYQPLLHVEDQADAS